MPNKTYQKELHNLGKLSKELRELYQLSQTRLAKLAGVSRSVIADIEQEKHFPNALTLLKLCDVFGVTPAELCAEAFSNFELNIEDNERTLAHKSLRNFMKQVLLDAAINEYKKRK